MGITSLFKRAPTAEEQIKSEGFEISSCNEECLDCTTKFPSHMAKDNFSALFGSTKPYGLHAVVPTNKADWEHDALGTSGTLAHAVGKWSKDASFSGLGESAVIKVTVSSLPSLQVYTNPDHAEEKAGDVLLLPFFVWARNVTIANAPSVLDRVVEDLIRYRDEGKETLPVTSYPEFPDVTIEADVNQAYAFLCSHRTRDKRCGVTAPIMKKEMEYHLRDLDLYRDASDTRPGGVQVAYVNHIGGHKFAANVIIYLKSGHNIWLARCNPRNCVPIIDECIVGKGKVWPDKVRQVQKFKAVEW